MKNYFVSYKEAHGEETEVVVSAKSVKDALETLFGKNTDEYPEILEVKAIETF